MKRKRTVRRLAAAAGAILILGCQTLCVSADDGTKVGYTYGYDYWGNVQYSPDAYDPECVCTAGNTGLDQELNAPEGMFINGQDIYVCDTGNNRIVEFHKDGTNVDFVRSVTQLTNDPSGAALAGPTDISVSDDGDLYICDKGNHRIVKADSDLNYQMEFTKPSDATFDQSVEFLPDKLAVDRAGRVYCIADNVNKGMIRYESDGTFTGFYGASKVTYDWTDYIWKRLATKAQRAAMQSFVPTEYDNVFMDKEGFLFACTTNVSAAGLRNGSEEPVRRLNLIGNNILIENGNQKVIGDTDWDNAGGYKGPSLITDITTLDNGVYFCLDKVRGHIFGYDTQGNLLFAFGGNGNMAGCFRNPTAIDHMGNDLIILDADSASLTVMTPTEYGTLIYKAIEEYHAGDYEMSGETWTQVRSLNGNYDQAYIGIGRALMREGKYHEAMRFFRNKWDARNYSKAFRQYRKEWVEENIGWIFLVALTVVLIPLVRRKVRIIRQEIRAAGL